MKRMTLFTVCGAITFCLLFTPVPFEVQDIFDQYDAYNYFIRSLLGHGRHSTQNSTTSLVGDKIIVMAMVESEDTSWVARKLPDWQRAIYHVKPPDPTTYALTTPINKGHEAMAYLTYIVDHYNSSLPSVIAFLHAHRQGFFKAWHVDAPFHDNVLAMRSLQLDFVIQNGYVNLRCNPNPGCTKRYKRPGSHVNRQVWQDIFSGTTTLPLNASSQGRSAVESPSSVQNHETGRYMNIGIASACCAQFAVSREQIWKRPLEDYVRIRQWVFDTERDDANSWRVMEYLWHVIFGKDRI